MNDPCTGTIAPISEPALARITDFETDVILRYPKSERVVTNLWPAAVIEPPPPERFLAYTLGEMDIAHWPDQQHRIHNESKNKFFTTAELRVPPAIWLCPPEVATAAAATRIAQEIYGIPDPQEARQLIASNVLDHWMTLAEPLWTTALLAYRSSCLDPALSLDFRTNCLLGACELLLTNMEKKQTQLMPARPQLSKEDLVSLSIAHDTIMEDYQGPGEQASVHLLRMDGTRKNQTGLYSDTLYHFVCVECGSRSANYPAMQTHEAGPGCQSPIKPAVKICSQCDLTIGTREGAKIHHATLCRRPASQSCPVCGIAAITEPCICSKNATMFWNTLRDYLTKGTNPLLNINHMDITRALLHLHFLAEMDFAPVTEEDNTDAKIASIRDDPQLLKEEDIINTLASLPVLKAGGAAIYLPAVDKEYTLAHISEMVRANIIAPDTSDNEETQSTESNSRKESGQWDNHQEKTGVDIEQYREAFLNSTKTAKVAVLKQALSDMQVLGNLMAADLVDGREDLKTKLFKLNCGIKTEQKYANQHNQENKNTNADNTTRTAHMNTTSTAGQENHKTPPRRRPTITPVLLGLGKGTRDKRDNTDSVFPMGGGHTHQDISCANESHDIKPKFKTEMEKLNHLITMHSCPYKLLVNPPCRQYFEFDSEMSRHIDNFHVQADLIACELCNMKFTTLSQRDAHITSAHVICVVCGIFFKDFNHLADHNDPPCKDVAHLRPTEKTAAGAFLTPVAKTELDAFRQVVPDPSAELSNSLSIMASAIPGIPEKVKTDLMNSFASYAALNKALTHYEKYPAHARKLRRCLLQPPNFDHPSGSRENLTKVTDFIGNTEVWHPSHNPKNYFENFLKLQEINTAICGAVTACSLTHGSAVALLLQKFSPDTLCHLESRQYSKPNTWNYDSILNVSQDLFFSLDLADLATAAEGAKKLPSERFHEFFSRVYKLLSTASLGRSEAERLSYIKSNMRRLALRAAPYKIKLKIEKLEVAHGIEYTAQEVADLVRSEEAMNHPPAENHEMALLGTFQVSRAETTDKPRETARPRTRRLNAVNDHTNNQQTRENSTTPSNHRSPSPRAPQGQGAQEQRRPPWGGDRNHATSNTQPTDQGGRQWQANRPPQNPVWPAQRQAQQHPHQGWPPNNTGWQNQSRWQHQGTRHPQPGPHGPIHTPKDMYSSAQEAQARADYIAEQKRRLNVREDDLTKYCFACGAGHPNLHGKMGDYHPRGKCRAVAFSDNVHQCPHPTNLRLFHNSNECPTAGKRQLRSVIRLIDSRNS